MKVIHITLNMALSCFSIMVHFPDVEDDVDTKCKVVCLKHGEHTKISV